jgi:alpha-galactosidase
MHQIRFRNTSFLNVYNDGTYDIVMGETGYHKCFPAIDGKALSDAKVSILNGKSSATITYKTNSLSLTLTFTSNEETLLLSTSLTELDGDSIERVSPFQNADLKGVYKLLSHGYFSWDQSFLINAADVTSTEANAVGVILNKEEAVLAGYLNHDRFFQTFTYSRKGNRFLATADIYLEGKDLTGINEIKLSETVFFSSHDLDLCQKRWADMVVEKNNIRVTGKTTKGWCSWYYDYFWFTGDILESHLIEFAPYKERLGLDVFVIDANHFEHLGDWLHPHPSFHKGMKYYAEKITEAGYTPGIWIGPWMVADRSRVFREHKEWLCRDEKGELIEFMNPLGEDNVWGYRSKIHYCLDTSNPEAFGYLRNVFRTYHQWGFRYFKTDFMFWGSMDRFEGGWYHDGVNKHNLIADKSQRPVIKRHSPGKTRIEYFIDVLKMIREEIGEDSIWLGCGQPIWASAGYVNCMRISRDVGARWNAHNSPKELLNDLALRNFANNRFYEVDPDCILLRTWETKITETEAVSLALFMGVAQGMIMTSDYIHECPEDRIDLFRFVTADNSLIEFRPLLLGRETDIIVYGGTRTDNGLAVVFLFNNGETAVEKIFSLSQLDVEGTYMVQWKKEGMTKLNGYINCSLAPHESALLYISDAPFTEGWQPKKISG